MTDRPPPLVHGRAGAEPPAASVVARIAAVVAAQPDAVAVTVATEAARAPAAVSYGALAGMVREVAAGLRARGVGPEVRVGVAVGRDLASIVAVLAVLEAGGAFVPLDEAWPAARRARLIDASGLAVLVVPRARTAAWADAGVPTLVLELPRAAGRCPTSSATPSNMAPRPL